MNTRQIQLYNQQRSVQADNFGHQPFQNGNSMYAGRMANSGQEQTRMAPGRMQQQQQQQQMHQQQMQQQQMQLQQQQQQFQMQQQQLHQQQQRSGWQNMPQSNSMFNQAFNDKSLRNNFQPTIGDNWRHISNLNSSNWNNQMEMQNVQRFRNESPVGSILNAPSAPIISNYFERSRMTMQNPQSGEKYSSQSNCSNTLDEEFERARANMLRKSNYEYPIEPAGKSSSVYRSEIDSDRESFNDEETEMPTEERNIGKEIKMKLRGLSGCGVRWYMRFLKAGMSQEKAIEAAWMRRRKPYARGELKAYQKGKIPSLDMRRQRESISGAMPGGSRITRQISPAPGLALSAGSRFLRSVSPAAGGSRGRYKPSSEPQRRRRTTRSPVAGKKSGEAKSFITAILTAKDSAITISQSDLSLLSEALGAELSTSYGLKPKFHGIYFKTNRLLLDCETEETVEWLHRVVPRLRKWNGPELEIIVGEEMKSGKYVRIFLPRSIGENGASLLSIIEAQNDGINTSAWTILGEHDENGGKLLQLKIDDESWRRIKEVDCILYYRFGKIQVKDWVRTAKHVPSSRARTTKRR